MYKCLTLDPGCSYAQHVHVSCHAIADILSHWPSSCSHHSIAETFDGATTHPYDVVKASWDGEGRTNAKFRADLQDGVSHSVR